MNFGVWIPNCRHLATPDIIRGAGIRAEQLGYESVWVSDHVVVSQANIANFGETIFDPLVTLPQRRRHGQDDLLARRAERRAGRLRHWRGLGGRRERHAGRALRRARRHDR